jgi:hypothetical protein
MFLIGMSGGESEPDVCEAEFAAVLKSIAIDGSVRVAVQQQPHLESAATARGELGRTRPLFDSQCRAGIDSGRAPRWQQGGDDGD